MGLVSELRLAGRLPLEPPVSEAVLSVTSASPVMPVDRRHLSLGDSFVSDGRRSAELCVLWPRPLREGSLVSATTSSSLISDIVFERLGPLTVRRPLKVFSSSGLTSGITSFCRSSSSIERLFDESRMSALCSLRVSLPRMIWMLFEPACSDDVSITTKVTVMVGNCGAGLLERDDGWCGTASGK